jgi:protein-arginine kinase activator protein McsA
MYAHARDLEFEEAAHIRDQIAELKRGQFRPVIAAA